ncbi:hypothetical protein DFA_05799 [Cavenderia fasciculata]|uniref:N-acetyltransferase domain-containing protein n=1 Tax=Cavenderia fasciculata TaxID=261658 RepID=F4PMS1_CACFS|nr:uncharacterized protein DFA_05799 [Cavenderia fasciculata]EGG23665.1 hypothetical protein DFA_05799 [Cavenderia fasciculata]|eukprot:XP_004361516.1 hypothetical protein DFA_05799 [Cavenderia fasciculata]
MSSMSLNSYVTTKKGLKLYVRVAEEKDCATLDTVINWAYRGKEGTPDPWTTEKGLVAGKRIDEAGLLQELKRDPETARVILVELIKPVVQVEDGAQEETTKEERTIVGSIKIDRESATSTDVLIGMFSVDPSLQSNGIGQILFKIAESFALEHWKCTRGVLHVLSVRQELLNWYYSMNYTPSGELIPFLHEKHTDSPLIDDLCFSTLYKSLI